MPRGWAAGRLVDGCLKARNRTGASLALWSMPAFIGTLAFYHATGDMSGITYLSAGVLSALLVLTGCSRAIFWGLACAGAHGRWGVGRGWAER